MPITFRFFLPHVIILFFTAILSLVLCFIAWRRKEMTGARYLSLTMLASAIWSFLVGMDSAAVQQPVKIFFAQIEYIGFVSIAPLMFMFILDYTHQLKRLNRWGLFILWFLPVLTLLLAWTNGLHGLIWSSFTPGSSEENVLVFHHGIMYWVFIIYIYSLYAIINLILLRTFFGSARYYRMQIGTMILGSLFPAVAGILYALQFEPVVPGLDWSPISMALTGIVFLWGIARQNLLNLTPIAREVLIEQLSDGVIVVNLLGRIVDINKAAQKMLAKPAKTIVGQPLKDAFPDGIELPVGPQLEQPVEFGVMNSTEYFYEAHVSGLFGMPGRLEGQLIVLRDITRRKNIEFELQRSNRDLNIRLDEISELHQQLREQAIHDVLTGLFNRRYLDETLDREIARARRKNYPVSLLMLDIDHFKQINDTFGHQAGDQYLQVIGRLLKNKIRREDIASRFGGDEFLVVMPDANIESALNRAEGFRQEMSEVVIDIEGQKISTTLSVGVAIFPDNGGTVEQTLLAVDQALYLAKTQGRNRVCLFSGPTPDGNTPVEMF